jgi:hypothetical protein
MRGTVPDSNLVKCENTKWKAGSHTYESKHFNNLTNTQSNDYVML